MTNDYLLNKKIKNSGYRFGYLANQLNLSRAGLYNKINGKTEFLASEIQSLSEILNLDIHEREDIFFNKEADNMDTNITFKKQI